MWKGTPLSIEKLMSLFLGIFFGVMFSLMILSVEKFYKYFGSKNDPGGSNSKQESTSEKDANKGQDTYDV